MTTTATAKTTDDGRTAVTFRAALRLAGFQDLDPGTFAEDLVLLPAGGGAPQVPVNADGRLWLHTGGPALASWAMVATSTDRNGHVRHFATSQSLSVYIKQTRGEHASAQSESSLSLAIGWS